MNRLERPLRRALLTVADARTDAQLLDCFVARRDEAAFTALVRRHGPMVLGVCRRTAGHVDDADDAFQATFLVLARKAGSLRAPARLGAWLYGVAYRTARKARAAADRLRGREKQVSHMPQPAVEEEHRSEEVLPLLDLELSRLPDKYQTPIILCDLEGVSRREAARRLGLPEGTLSSRLATGRRMLARRLTRYGLAVSGGMLAAVLTRQAIVAAPAALTASTVRAVLAYGTTACAASVKAAALAEGVMKAMLWMKLKIAAVSVLAAGFLLAGAGATALMPGQARATDPAKGGAAKPAADDASNPKPAAGDGSDAVWTLDFRFKSPRRINVDMPGKSRKLIWYLSYKVANPTEKDHTFIPDFELTVDDTEVHHDETLPASVRDFIEQDVIQQTEDPTGALGKLNLKTSVAISADPIPPSTPGAHRDDLGYYPPAKALVEIGRKERGSSGVAGVASWDDVDPDCKGFTIYVYGLSNGFKVDDAGKVRRKTLQLDFKRAGGEMQLVGEPRWLYIGSHGGTPRAEYQAEDLRRTIADLRKRLEKAEYAATVTDAQKALLQKQDEVAALRDQLTAAQVEVKALIDRCQALENKIRELEKEKPKKSDKPADAPPAEAPKIEGVVTKAGDNLVVLSIGKDAGLDVGMTLEVYRLDPPLYVGRVNVLAVRAADAVAKPEGGVKPKSIQVGDRVTTRLLD